MPPVKGLGLDVAGAALGGHFRLGQCGIYLPAAPFLARRLEGVSSQVAQVVPAALLLACILKLVKAVQDFSAGCSTSIEPQNDMLFIK